MAETMILTFKFKRKNGARPLGVAARKVNCIWNYANETSLTAIRRDGKFLSAFDLNNLLSGTSKTLKIHSQTVQAVAEEYAKSRKQAKKRKLEWRSSKGSRRSLGWVPFKSSGVKISGDRVSFGGKEYRFFKHREIEGRIKAGCFVEDACGDWYVCFQCEVPKLEAARGGEVAIDLGQKAIATTSDGEVFDNPKTYYAWQDKLAKAQRYGKKKQAARIHRKIARIRKDNLHKISASLTNTYARIIVGNLILKASKSTLDASFRGLIPLLEYKASRRQGEVVLVNEAFTTVTCSNCLERTGPTGLTGLSVREWVCGHCGQSHDRDVNAARNILRIGTDAPKTPSKPQASRGEGSSVL